MMRSVWTEVSLDHYDYLNARVEAMAEYIKRLQAIIKIQNRELEILKGFDQDAKHDTDTDFGSKYPMPSVFFQPMSVQAKEMVRWL